MKMRSGAVMAVVALSVAACAPATGGPGAPGRFGADFAGTPRFINPGTMAALDGFTHAVQVGLTLYVSGEVPLDSTGKLVGPGDLAAQARQAFANLATVLNLAGAQPGDLVRLKVYVVNLRPGDFDVIRQAAGPKFFPPRQAPAGTVLGVQALPGAGMLVAVDAVAQLKGLFPDRTAPSF